jgi:chemotaxis protein methyltransferase CheR
MLTQATIATDDYEFIRKLVYDRSRINLGPDKVELVRSRVQKRLRALGLPDFEAYCRLLGSAGGEDEMGELLDVISTNVTEFFREWRHFEFLQNTALPEWVKKTGNNTREKYRVWSAACSSGEEPYSLAILLSEFFRQTREGCFELAATDLSTRVLAIAKQAVYRDNRVKTPNPDWMRRYFQQGVGKWEGYYRVKPEITNRVEFRHLNLMEWPYPFTQTFDAIFCRNVMIYFDRKTQEQLVPRLAERLNPGGYLFVGHSESLVGLEHGLRSVQPSVYRRL